MHQKSDHKNIKNIALYHCLVIFQIYLHHVDLELLTLINLVNTSTVLHSIPHSVEAR